jgi:hypothetical protein
LKSTKTLKASSLPSRFATTATDLFIDDDYYYDEPSVLFPGQWFTLPFHPDDGEHLFRRIWIPGSSEPLKPRPKELVHETLLVNVGLAEDLKPVLRRMSSLPFTKNINQYRAKRLSSGDEESEIPKRPS